jgi:hypothetical protein
MEGSRIFLTSTVYNKLTLRFKENEATPTLYPLPIYSTPLRYPLTSPFCYQTPFYSTLSLPLLSPLNLKW